MNIPIDMMVKSTFKIRSVFMGGGGGVNPCQNKI